MDDIASRVPGIVHPDLDEAHRADQLVLRTAAAQGWTREEIVQVRAMLGFAPTDSGGRYTSTGRREGRAGATQEAATPETGPERPAAAPGVPIYPGTAVRPPEDATQAGNGTTRADEGAA